MAHPHDRHRQAGPVGHAELRISDSERAEVTEALCRHYSEGRLDHDELEERTAAVARAKTRAELSPLLADLPPLPGATPPPAERRNLRFVVLAAAMIVAVFWAWALLHAAFHAVVLWVALAVVFMALRRRHAYRLGRRF